MDIGFAHLRSGFKLLLWPLTDSGNFPRNIHVIYNLKTREGREKERNEGIHVLEKLICSTLAVQLEAILFTWVITVKYSADPGIIDGTKCNSHVILKRIKFTLRRPY